MAPEAAVATGPRAHAVVYIDRNALRYNAEEGADIVGCIAVRRGPSLDAAMSEAHRCNAANILDADGNVVAVVRGVFGRGSQPKMLDRTPVNVFVDAPHGVELVVLEDGVEIMGPDDG